MIETKEYQLTQKEFLKILVQNRFKNKVWWLLPFIFLCGLLLLVSGEKSGLFFILFIVLYPILVIVSLYRFVYTEENKNFYLNKKIIFDAEQASIIVNNDLERTIDFKYIVKIEENENYWLLFINKINFHYVPKNIFYTTDDFNAFKKLLHEKTKNVKRT